MATNSSVQGKVVAITGGARGIGLATAAALTALGARVAIGDIDEVTLKESATQLGLPAYANSTSPTWSPSRRSSTRWKNNSVRSTSWSTTPASCRSAVWSTNPRR